MAYDEIKDPFRRLVRIMERLQEPGGCPWDLEQTHASLKPYMIEEAYEALDAIDRQDWPELEEELGDVLLQVVFHSVLANRTGKFHIDQVIGTAATKMVRRHPHVFGEAEADTAAKVLKNWEQLKVEERRAKGARMGAGSGEGAPPSTLAGVPMNLPALLKAQRMQEKAARTGFDWETPGQVLDKVEEEIAELRAALGKGAADEVKEELGDLLFALVNVARMLDFDAEDAARLAGEKFRTRFREVELHAHETGRDLHEVPADEMERVWRRAKAR
jgi:ATP diphosphatase